MKAWIKTIALFLLVVGVMVGGFWGAHQSGTFNLASINIHPVVNAESGSFQIVKQRVEVLLASYLGRSIWSFDIEEVTQQVKKEKWIKSLRVSRKLPNEIRLEIETQEVAALAFVNGQVNPVAIDGSFLPPLDDKEIPDTPILSGEQLMSNQKYRQRAVKVLELLPEYGFFSQETVSEIFHDSKKGFVAILNNGGYEVILGQKSSVEKVEQINQVLTYVQTKNVNARVIDARPSKKVLVRLRKGS